MLSSFDQDDAYDLLVGLFGTLGASVLILAIIGSTMGQKRKLVVYDGRADLHGASLHAASVCWGPDGGYLRTDLVTKLPPIDGRRGVPTGLGVAGQLHDIRLAKLSPAPRAA